MYTSTIISAFGLFAAASAHFAIQNPAPIPGSAIKDPLDPSGSNFPCHGVDLTQGSSTDLKAGSSYPLEFNLGNGANTAVHGGGSCQLSLTYETDPAKQKNPANWKVIKSFIGGCPTDAPGNLPSAVMCPNGGVNCVNKLDFAVPSEVNNGNAILAWTWFNNIGNREMYMNCAKVSISGGSGQIDSLPGLFTANLASLNQCKTSEQQNVDFPSPGKYVQKDASPNYPIKAPTGNCGSGSGSGSTPSTGGSGSSSGSSGSGAAAPAASAAPAVSAAPAAPAAGAGSGGSGAYTGIGAASSRPANGVIGATPTSKASSNPGGIFAPGAAGSAATPAAVATTLATVPVAAPSVASPAQPAAASPATGSTGSSTSGGSAPAGAVACSVEGFYCVDATHFALCNFGYGIPQDVAAGTTCTGTAIKAINFKRSTVHRHLAARNIHHKSF